MLNPVSQDKTSPAGVCIRSKQVKFACFVRRCNFLAFCMGLAHCTLSCVLQTSGERMKLSVHVIATRQRMLETPPAAHKIFQDSCQSNLQDSSFSRCAGPPLAPYCQPSLPAAAVAVAPAGEPAQHSMGHP